MVFDTFSGKSKCIHEEGTLPNEDPLIESVGGGTGGALEPVTFPGDPVMFEVILADQGDGSSSTFMLSAQQGKENLGIFVDGAVLAGSGIEFGFEGTKDEKKLTKQVAVTRGPQYFRNEAIELTLSSTW